MEYRILGPLEVRQADHEVALGGAKQRALLAVLLLNANAAVSRERLIDELWADEPPETARATLQVYVSQLRKALGRAAIETRGGGYGIWLEDGALDADRFERLVQEARDRPAAVQAERLREALALWRGDVLAGLDDSVCRSERARLEEQRLGALEQRIDADLDLGRHADLVPELESLVRDHPLREGFRGQLMLALYRSGRQADALETYRQGRQLLDEQLGLEPREELRRLEQAILTQDPGIAAPPRSVGDRMVRTAGRRRRWALLAGAVVVAGAVAALAVVLSGGSSGVVVEPDSVAVIDPRTNELVTDLHVGGQPVSVVAAFGSVWVADADHGDVLRFDASSGRLKATIHVGRDVDDLAVGFGSVWVTTGDDGRLERIDPVTNHFAVEPVYTRPVRWVATAPTGESRGVWVTSGNQLVRIDPRIDQPVSWAQIPTPTGLAVGNEVWVTTEDQQLLRISGRQPAVEESFLLPAPALAPTADARSVWLIVYGTKGQVWTVPTPLGRPRPFAQSGRLPLDLAVDGDSIWSVDAHGTVRRYDARFGDVRSMIEVAPTVRSSIAVGEDKVWVAIQRPS